MKFSLQYNTIEGTEKKARKFASGNPSPNIRYNFLYNQEDLDKYKTLEADFVIRTKNVQDLKTLLTEKLPVYLDIPVSDWETFSILQDLGVKDILISGPLALSSRRIKRGKRNTNIRAILNANANFYIRPEDLKLYEGIIDFAEFDHSHNETEEKVMYDIYSREEYFGDLHWLIPRVPMNIPNKLFPQDFGEIRANCKLECLIPGKKCTYCSSTYSLLKQLIELEKKDNVQGNSLEFVQDEYLRELLKRNSNELVQE